GSFGGNMKRFAIALFISLAVFGGGVVSAHAQSVLTGDYSCSFGATSSYIPPGGNTTVPVLGQFRLGISKDGTIAIATATVSVFNGGSDPLICSYNPGTGRVTKSPSISAPGEGTLSAQGKSSNPAICPSGDAMLDFYPLRASDLMMFYHSSSSFSARGSCLSD